MYFLFSSWLLPWCWKSITLIALKEIDNIRWSTNTTRTSTHWDRDKWTPFRRWHLQMHFLWWKWIPIKISLKFVPKGPINNIPAMVQIMAWRRPGDKPLSEAMMFSLPTQICVDRPQWIKIMNPFVKCCIYAPPAVFFCLFDCFCLFVCMFPTITICTDI